MHVKRTCCTGNAADDGHEGTIGITKGILGIKAADPKMLVSMGGLSGATRVALDTSP